MVLPRLLILPLFASQLVGCQYFDRARECRTLARAANPALLWIDRERKLHPESPATYRAIALRYEEVLGKLPAPVKGRPPDLSSEYQVLLRDAAHDARAYADALDSGAPMQKLAAHVTASKNTKREAQLVARVTATCGSR